jgi:hypothetical protein
MWKAGRQAGDSMWAQADLEEKLAEVRGALILQEEETRGWRALAERREEEIERLKCIAEVKGNKPMFGWKGF